MENMKNLTTMINLDLKFITLTYIGTNSTNRRNSSNSSNGGNGRILNQNRKLCSWQIVDSMALIIGHCVDGGGPDL